MLQDYVGTLSMCVHLACVHACSEKVNTQIPRVCFPFHTRFTGHGTHHLVRCHLSCVAHQETEVQGVPQHAAQHEGWHHLRHEVTHPHSLSHQQPEAGQGSHDTCFVREYEPAVHLCEAQTPGLETQGSMGVCGACMNLTGLLCVRGRGGESRSSKEWFGG